MKNLTSLSLKTVQGELFVLDQTLLPQRQLWILCQTVPAMVAMIKALQLRGAPAIGIGACLLLAYRASVGDSREQLGRVQLCAGPGKHLSRGPDGWARGGSGSTNL